MDTAINFIKDWMELVTNLFSKYPLSGALVTIAAVFYFLHLEKNKPSRAKADTRKNIALVLLIWVIGVPILGWFISVVGGVTDFLEFLYVKFEEQPIVVLVLLSLAIIAHFIWGFISQDKAPEPLWRGIGCAVGFSILVAILVPVFSAFEGDLPKTNDTLSLEKK